MNTAISEAEQLYWNIFETASDGVLITDLETGNVLEANPVAAEMHGYTREAFCGLQLQRLIHAKSLPLFADYVQVIQQGGLFDVLAQHLRQDGSLLNVEWRAVAIKYQSRTCALALLRDVSKRVQAENQLQQRDELLRQSEARYRSLFTSMNEGFALCEIIFDDDGVPCDFRFLEVNAAFERQTGISVADIRGKTIREHFPDIEMSWIEIYGKVALTGESAQFENYNHNTGRHYEVFSFSPAKGKLAMLFLDISEQKQAETELQESRAVLRAILDNTPDPVYIKDRQSRIVMANPAVAKVVGKPLNEILGKTDSEFYSDPAIGQALRDNDLRIMTAGQGEVLEETVLTPAGHRIFLSSKTPYRNAAGEIIGLIGISHDITERKQAEETQAWLASFPKLNPSPIVEVDFSGNIHYLNPSAQRSFPELQEKGRQHPWLRDLDAIVAEFLQGDTGTKATARDVQIGEATYRQIISYGAENQRVRIYGFDITPRIKAEEAMRQTRDELEIRIQERTQELKKANEQLQAEIADRQHLAQNLHDAVNQSLFSAGLIAEVLPRLWERDQESARRSLEDLRRLTRGAQAEMRGLLAELRPSTLTDTELGDLLRLLGNAFSGRTNIPVTVTINGEGSLPAETQVALYRICQEALNNIAKHAKASQVQINLHHIPGSLELHIRDNGRGFGTSELTPAGHYGLGMMRERAEAVGARLTVTSRPGKGTEVSIQWMEKEVL